MKVGMGKIAVPDHVAELVRGMHPLLKRKIKAALGAIAADPDSGKLLKEKLEGLRSFRVSRFRIVYRVGDDGWVEIIAIGPRRIIYEETFRLLRREARKR